MIYKKLDCEIQLVKVISRTDIDKIPIEKHIVRFIQLIRHYVITSKVFHALIEMNASNKCILNILLDPQDD